MADTRHLNSVAILRTLQSTAATRTNSAQLTAPINPEIPANIIVGLGPTGLPMAIEACKKDSQRRSVLAITDREDYTREAIFRLDVDLFPYLEELVGREIIQDYFNRKLIGPKQSLNGWDFHVIQINTFEKLLLDTLRKYANVQILCLPKRSGCHVSGINKSERTLQITYANQETQTFRFKYLIGADGPHHTMANLVNAGIEYHDTQNPQIYHHHARVTYRLPDELCADEFRSRLAKQNSLVDVASLTELGWQLASHPEIRMFVIDKRFFIAAECPYSLSPHDANAIDRWIRTVIGALCPHASMDTLERMDAAVFDVPLREANRTIVPLPPAVTTGDSEETVHQNTSYFLLAGDALRSTHYQTGSGAGVGLREAMAFGEYMASAQTVNDLCIYHARIAAIRADNRVRVDQFVDKRRQREELKQTEHTRDISIDNVSDDLGRQLCPPMPNRT